MKLNQLKSGVILSYISMIMGYAISIIYTPIMIRLLGQSEYGLYSLVSSVVSYLGVLSFGFGSAYIRYYSRYKIKNDEKNIAKLNGMFIIIYSITAFITIFAGLVLVLNSNTVFGGKLTTHELLIAKTLLAIMVFNLAISFPASVFNSYIIANEQYFFQKILEIIRNLVNPLVMLPVLLMGYKSVGMVVVTTFLTMFVIIGNVVFCIKNLKMKFYFKNFDYILMKEMTIFSSYIFINMIVDQINWNADKFLLGKFNGTAAVAIYGIASQLNTYFIAVSTAISSVFIPKINSLVATIDNNNILTDLFTRVGRIQFILVSLICSGFIFFGQAFIVLWAGVNYKQAYLITLLLIIPVTIPCIQNLGLEIQKAKNMHKFRSLIYLLIALVNIGISIPLSKMYGGVGAAIGTAIAILVGNGLLMNWYYHKTIGLDIKYFWNQILKFLPALIVPIIVGIFISRNINLYNLWILLICGLIYFIIFGISMWLFGMNNYEKELIKKPVSKILGKIINYI